MKEWDVMRVHSEEVGNMARENGLILRKPHYGRYYSMQIDWSGWKRPPFNSTSIMILNSEGYRGSDYL